MKTMSNVTPITRAFLVASLLVGSSNPTTFAQVVSPSKGTNVGVIFKTKDIQVQLTTVNPSTTSTSAFVTGVGTISLSGQLVVANGACARVRVEVLREPLGRGPTTTQKQGVYEFCSASREAAARTANVDISDTLSGSEDDAMFKVRVTSLDSLNKETVRVTGTLTLRFPTSQKRLTVQPNVPITLNQGQDETRTFSLIPNTPGSVRIEVKWQGAAPLRVRVFRPGQGANPQSGGVINKTSPTSPMTLDHNITATDIAGGQTWAINVLNASQSSIAASNITFMVTYTVQQ